MKTPKRILIQDDDRWYALVEEDDGTIALQVVSGGFAMYMMDIPLNEEELQAYREEGASYIRRLAANISAKPSNYHHRSRPT